MFYIDIVGALSHEVVTTEMHLRLQPPQLLVGRGPHEVSAENHITFNENIITVLWSGFLNSKQNGLMSKTFPSVSIVDPPMEDLCS